MPQPITATVRTDLTSSFADLNAVISAIGTDSFADELLVAAHRLCGVEHCSIVQFSDNHLYGRASASLDHSQTSSNQLKLYVEGDYWREDPGLLECQRQGSENSSSFVRVDIESIENERLRTNIWSSQDVAHRFLLWTGTPLKGFGISLCRSNSAGDLTMSEVADLERAALSFLSTLRKHAAICWTTSRFPHALTSLSAIASCVAACGTQIPRREFEVCTRLIYGMTTTGISLELDIGEGSVVTYRKRLYERLGIGSHRELLVWYVHCWDQLFSRELDAAA